MSFYGFEYFCGANVTVAIEDFYILEAAGISYEVTDSKRPIYGYSSRLFDAVAQGRVLVQGTLLINYVHQDYLYTAITEGLEVDPLSVEEPVSENFAFDEQELEDLARQLDPETYAGVVEALQKKWQTTSIATTRLSPTLNPNDIAGGLDIRISFGEQTEGNPFGFTGTLLRAVHFVGRGQVIRIDEETLVEAYPFFAREIYSTKSSPVSYSSSLEPGAFERTTTIESS